MQVQALIKHYHKCSFPNIKAVNKVIQDNIHIQNAEFQKIKNQQLQYLQNERNRVKIHYETEEN